MTKFDPNAAASPDSGIFGLPYTEKEAQLVLVPVPWEATTSYGAGASRGPSAILEASKQVDLYDLDVMKPYEAGIHMLPESRKVWEWNDRAKVEAERVIEAGGMVEGNPSLKAALQVVNELGSHVNEYVYGETKRLLSAEKIVGIVGGDHSVPFGALKAIAEKFYSFGVLHFDAHSDTRKAYEGFTWSHASIMYNVLEKIPQMEKLCQVGIRDICEEEVDYCALAKHRVQIFYDRELSQRKFEGVTWGTIAREIVAGLPNNVWVSFDIDGLDPRFCPNTGTPVPGGLDFHEANFILSALVKSGRRIIGFDLNEVAPDPSGESEWDGNVGARMLYKLCGWTLASQNRAKMRI